LPAEVVRAELCVHNHPKLQGHKFTSLMQEEIMWFLDSDEEEMHSLEMLCNKLQHHHRKRNFIRGRCFEPTVKSVIQQPRTTPDRCAMFVSIPYMTLGRPSSWDKNVLTEESHPVSSLLEYYYGLRRTAKRDSRQVFRKHKAGKDVVMIPQLWCVILNRSKTA
jgi:hypothetical protein